MRTLRLLVVGLLAATACSADGGSGSSGDDLDPINDGQGDTALPNLDPRDLPAFADMWANYPNGEADDVKALIGGNVNATWVTNTCTIRLSRALNYAGFDIPSDVSGLNTLRGGDDKRYAYRVAEMRRYLLGVLGQPTITGTDPSLYQGHKGIIMFVVKFSDATGHFDLWDGSMPAHEQYFDQAIQVALWETAQ